MMQMETKSIGWLAKVRPQVVLGIASLTAIALAVIILDVEYGETVATACVVGISTILPKLIEREP